MAEHKKKMAVRQARSDRGEKPCGKAPAPPSPQPEPKDQYNFTDPESRIMKSGGGFEQCYNAQAGIIKSAMGFRQFLLRGVNEVSTEWTLVCLAYNLRRLPTLDRTRNVVATA